MAHPYTRRFHPENHQHKNKRDLGSFLRVAWPIMETAHVRVEEVALQVRLSMPGGAESSGCRYEIITYYALLLLPVYGDHLRRHFGEYAKGTGVSGGRGGGCWVGSQVEKHCTCPPHATAQAPRSILSASASYLQTLDARHPSRRPSHAHGMHMSWADWGDFDR